jgi:hypothetical protein
MERIHSILKDIWLLLKKVQCANNFNKKEAEAYKRLKNQFDPTKEDKERAHDKKA